MKASDINAQRSDALWKAFNTDGTVHQFMSAGRSLEDLVAQLVSEKNELIRRLMAVEAIVPKKIRLPSGKVVYWHCPVDLIPFTDTTLTPPGSEVIQE